MKTFKQQAAQGDLLVTRIDELPTGVTEQAAEDGRHVLAHSETGHHHVIPAEHASLFVAADSDGFRAFLVVHQDTQIEHLRAWDTHEALAVTPGVYRLDRQREYIADGFRRAAD
jgi:hypothetical protein